MNSRIYVGRVRHRRFTPAQHAFSYRLFMMYLDLDELPGLFDRFWLWSARGFNLAWFRRSDHMAAEESSLKTAVLDHIEHETGMRPGGPVCLLSHLRYFGFGFTPVSFYYCFDEDGDTLAAVVAEVNTPWDMQYRWRLSSPGDELQVHIENHRKGIKVFDATMDLEARPVNSRQLFSALVSFPLITLKVVGAIYFEALRLWLKKVPIFDHPHTTKTPEEAKHS